jgi:hypothetical protein
MLNIWEYIQVISLNALQTELHVFVHSFTWINEHCNNNKYTSINNTLHLYFTNTPTSFSILQIVLGESYIKQAYVKCMDY